MAPLRLATGMAQQGVYYMPENNATNKQKTESRKINKCNTHWVPHENATPAGEKLTCSLFEMKINAFCCSEDRDIYSEVLALHQKACWCCLRLEIQIQQPW